MSRQGDKTTQGVIDKYVGYLAEEIADFENILRHEAIGLDGGVANEGAILFDPLKKAVGERTYIVMDCSLKIVGVRLGNKTGI